MAKPFKVEWTQRSLDNALAISQWLFRKFSPKEVDQFFSILHDFEKVVATFPDMFPGSSKQEEIRQAVLHKNLTVYYVIKSRKIVVIAMKDNRQLRAK